jgi:LysR substrate binding domain
MDNWPFTRGGEMHRVRISGPLSASTVDAVRAACIAGVGIAMLTYWDVHRQIERGDLQRIVLVDVKPLEIGIWAVFPTRTQMPARVRAFIDALRRRLLAGAEAPPAGAEGQDPDPRGESRLKLPCQPLIMRQIPPRLFERLILRLKLRDEADVVGRLAHGRSLAKPLELVTYHRHRVVDLLAQLLI